MMTGLLVQLMGAAIAGDDPWIAPAKTTNFFVAVSGEQFKDFVAAEGNTIPGDDPIRSVGGKIYIRHGLGADSDLTLDIPLVSTWSSGPSLGEMYARTTGIGLLQAELRHRWLDAVSTRAVLRTGALHQRSRGRLTNLSEGTTDLGFGIGTGAVFPGARHFYTVDLGASYWLRFPVQSGNDIPADEVSWSSNVLVSPTRSLGIGATVSGHHRLDGQNLGDITVSNPDDQWAALQAQQIKVGARLMLYSTEHRPAFSIAVLRAVWARNNPIDTTLVELGVGWDMRRD
jgi:hypothetical protein